MKLYNLCTTFIASLFLIACSSNNKIEDVDNKAFVTKDISIELPSSNILDDGEYQEALTITYDKKTYNLLVLLKNNNNVLSLVAMSDLGIKLFEANYFDGHIKIKKFIEIDKLPKANQVLLDIFLAHASKENLDKAFANKINISEEDIQRIIKDLDDNIIYTIKYIYLDNKKLPIELVHNMFNYKINIKHIN